MCIFCDSPSGAFQAWTQLCASYDAASREARFYVNWELVGSAVAGYKPNRKHCLRLGAGAFFMDVASRLFPCSHPIRANRSAEGSEAHKREPHHAALEFCHGKQTHLQLFLSGYVSRGPLHGLRTE